MADLLLVLVVLNRREKQFRQQEMSLDNFTNEELRCRYRFGQDSIEFLTFDSKTTSSIKQNETTH